jgi:hypothetical protein
MLAMKRILLSLSVLLVLSGCNRTTVPFDPAKAAVINEDCDLMAHCSTFVPVGDGTVYFAYYRDSTQTLEAPGKTTIVPVFAKAEGLKTGDTPSFERISYQEFIHSGETVGDYTHSPDRAPYDPNLLLLGDTLMVYFVGCIDGTVTTCVRPYDTVTDRFSDRIEVCTLSYGDKTVPFDTKGLFGMYEDLGFKATFNNDLLMSGAFVPYKGEWYCALGTAFLPRSCPVIVKTADGVNFDLVMLCPEFLYGCAEASVAIWKDDFYVIMRNSGVERGGRGCYVARYDATGYCLAGPVYLSEAQSKPAIILHKGRMYLFYNANPFLQTDWGLVSRSRLRISEIDRNCRILRSWDITDPYGIHYPYVQEIDGQVWISFTEDRKQLDVNQTRTNISFTPVRLR